MSRKVTKKRTARFALEPDGFSIHTFELSQKLSGKEFRALKEKLYEMQKHSDMKGWMYKYDLRNHGEGTAVADQTVHVCNLFRDYGVRIRLEHNRGEGFDTYYLRIVVNPRKLTDPDCSYLGILPPKKSSVGEVKAAFKTLFQNTPIEERLNRYLLSRVDLCANIRCDKNKLFRELVRVLRKLPTPPKYERLLYRHDDRKEANRYNKHYLRFHCGTHELVIYDKVYQMQENGLVVDYEKLPEGILRFEIHCGRAYLRLVEKEAQTSSVEELLWLLMQESRERIIENFSRCFSSDVFVQMEELTRQIEASPFKGKTKNAMLALAERLQRDQSVDKALKKLDAAGYNTDGLLKRFSRLGVSPIPLWKSFCAEALPGPVELLKAVAEGSELAVPYMEIKHK